MTSSLNNLPTNFLLRLFSRQCSCERVNIVNLFNYSVFPQSLPEEERDRVMTEEKLGGAKLTGGVATSPHRARSPSIKVCKQLRFQFLLLL